MNRFQCGLVGIVAISLVLTLWYTGHLQIPSHIYKSLSQQRFSIDPFATMFKKNYNNTSIRLLCWVMTHPKNFGSKSLAIKNTWGKRCDKLVFMSSKEDKELGAVDLKVKEGRGNTWAKTRLGFKYVYDNHLNEYDWFLKADDDTYVVVDNLRYMLTPYNAEFPMALGEHYHRSGKKNYLTGGAGYVLSRGAVIRYAEKAFENKRKCPQLGGMGEDMKMGKCMTGAGVMLGDSRDEDGHGRFFQLQMNGYIAGKITRYPKIAKYDYGKGIDSLSKTAVSFHRMKDIAEIYAIDFMIYKLQVYGFEREFLGDGPAPLPPNHKAIPKQILERFGHPNLNKNNKIQSNQTTDATNRAN